jgi:hypothetical protein
LGVYRAWIEIVFVGSYINFPSEQFAGQDIFDLAMIAVMLICAVFSNRIRTLFTKASAYWLSGVLLVLGTVGPLPPCCAPIWLSSWLGRQRSWAAAVSLC